MRQVVLDAPLLLSWFVPDGDGRELRREYEAGTLTIVAPRSLPADLLALVARGGGSSPDLLAAAAEQLDRLGFDLRQPTAGSLAPWIALGLGADRAAYPALAASLDVRLATNDPELARIAAPLLVER